MYCQIGKERVLARADAYGIAFQCSKGSAEWTSSIDLQMYRSRRRYGGFQFQVIVYPPSATRVAPIM